jgi:putative transposase
MPLAPQEIRTFFVTSVTSGRRSIFQSARLAGLLIDVLKENRDRARFLLHEFVVMPDHFHILLTPEESAPLEKAVQYIKGGFSFRAKRDLGFRAEVWQPSFTNHRIRDARDYEQHRLYIRENPVKRFLVERAEMYAYSSAYPGAEIDPKPPWLKP